MEIGNGQYWYYIAIICAGVVDSCVYIICISASNTFCTEHLNIHNVHIAQI